MVSQALVEAVREEAGSVGSAILEDLEETPEQDVKGRSGKIPVFTLRRTTVRS